MATEESMGERMELEEEIVIRRMKVGLVERKRKEDKLIQVLH